MARSKKSASFRETGIVFGVRPIIEVLRAKRRFVERIYVFEKVPKAWKSISELLSPRTEVKKVSRPVLEKISGVKDHQGIVAFVGDFRFRSKPFEPKRHKFLMLLDGIQDPRNLGALIRSSYCVGIDGIVLTKKDSANMTGTAFKASSGLAEYMDIQVMPNSLAAAKSLKQLGYNFYIATFGGIDATKVNYAKPICLVIGSEGKGVSSEILNFGTKITIPQVKSEISYNASVAGGILSFLIANQINSFKKK